MEKQWLTTAQLLLDSINLNLTLRRSWTGEKYIESNDIIPTRKSVTAKLYNFDRPKLNQYSALSELASVSHFLLMCVCVCL